MKSLITLISIKLSGFGLGSIYNCATIGSPLQDQMIVKGFQAY